MLGFQPTFGRNRACGRAGLLLGIARTLVKAHLVLGGIGALVGLRIALALLLFTGVRAFTSSPAFSIGLLTALGLVAGLLLGGLVSLRPNQDVLRMRLAKVMGDGERWAVVVHARDHADESRERKIPEQQCGEIVAVL